MINKRINQEGNTETVLVIVSHRDDETVGLGGTIAKHSNNGDKVYGISMTDGVGARDELLADAVHHRYEASLRAANILGMEWIDGGNFLDNAMDSIPLLAVVRVIEEIKEQIEPSIVYTHSAADLNVDHRIVSQAALTAFRPQPDESWNEIRLFEVPSATDYGHEDITAMFVPNLLISIADTWTAKLEALKQYSTEIREFPHSRSYEAIKSLAQYRGYQVGLEMVEAFQLIRKIER